jgi:hypothetical protein
MLGNGILSELLAEVLYHVVALELAMHQHVEANLLLPAYCLSDVLPDRQLICGAVDISPAERGSQTTHLGCLGGKSQWWSSGRGAGSAFSAAEHDGQGTGWYGVASRG